MIEYRKGVDVFSVTPEEAKANLYAIMKGEKSGDGVVLMEDDSLEPAVCGRALHDEFRRWQRQITRDAETSGVNRNGVSFKDWCAKLKTAFKMTVFRPPAAHICTQHWVLGADPVLFGIRYIADLRSASGKLVRLIRPGE